MVGTNLKAETVALTEKRSDMEAEMNSIIGRLCIPGGPGLSGNLVDSEGFPRADIDIPAVREQRRRLAELRNNHVLITEKISAMIELLHSARLAPKSSAPNDSGTDRVSNNQYGSAVNPAITVSSQNIVPNDSSSVMDIDVVTTIPFAVVDEITDASPAAEDGLQLGDQILKFGNVEAGDNLLQRLATESHSNQGQAISVLVMRQGAPVNLTVTPRAWQGRGLLGCHFRIL